MEEKFVKVLQETAGKYIKFRQDEIILSNGHTTVRDVVVHPGAVAVAAVTAQNEVILVKQYRYPIGQVCYELPAGKLEPGEEPLATAKRELAEETGFQASTWEKLTAFYTAPGFTNEFIHLFLASGLQADQAHPDPDEIIEYESINIDTLRQKVYSGEIRDAKTIIGLFWILEKMRNEEISAG